MQTKYTQKNDILQKNSANTAESVVDTSSQSATLQRHASLADGVAQRAPEPRPNNTGMPDNLKSGIESLSGFSMDNVRVHYNSCKPATVQALAYTQGTDIHVAPGQEKHLPHEAWHVAQQMAGRVSPTTNINGMPVNDNAGLEHEADVMGEKAVQCKGKKMAKKTGKNISKYLNGSCNANTIQCVKSPSNHNQLNITVPRINKGNQRKRTKGNQRKRTYPKKRNCRGLNSDIASTDETRKPIAITQSTDEELRGEPDDDTAMEDGTSSDGSC